MTKYWGGPWVWNSVNPAMVSYVAPGASFALVDLRNMETQSQNNYAGGVGNGLFCTEDTEDLGADYTLLGIGAHITEVIPEMGASSAWNSLFGVQPQGTYLVDWLAYTLTDGSDVDGVTGPKPLMPGVGPPINETVIHLAGHSVIWRGAVNVRSGNSKHEKNIRDRYQKDLKAMFDTEPDDDHWRKYLSSLKEKTGQHWDDADEDYLLDKDMKKKAKKDKSRALAHSTTYTESWPTTGGLTSSQDLGWANIEQIVDMSVVSNQLNKTMTGAFAFGRMTTDIATSDMFASMEFISRTGTSCAFGPVARKDSSATLTYYFVQVYLSTANPHKRVAGTYTDLGTGTYTPVANDIYKITTNGSTIEALRNDISIKSVTDTAISGNTYAGVMMHDNSSVNPITDNWSGGNIPVATTNKMIMGTYL